VVWYPRQQWQGRIFPEDICPGLRDWQVFFVHLTFHFDVSLVKAKGLYDYQGGNADDLPFSEGDMISVVDRSDSDWYKAEKDGVIFSVPAAYLEIVEG
jgi:actin cytoskeleton-regulatory complex protein PAN1